jgi:hypothetical protein
MKKLIYSDLMAGLVGMRKRANFLGIIALLFFSVTSSSYALVISDTDVWQYENISSVSSSSIHPDSNASNMFGYYSNNTEHTNTVFNDTSAQGYWHQVEWTLNAPLTLGSFNLVASHDGTGAPYYRDQNYRGMSAFKLEYKDGADIWQTLYLNNGIGGITALLGDGQNHPVYGGGVNYTALWNLELFVDVTPTTAQTWRASFEQFGPVNYHASGPRILELDGYAYTGPGPVPVPEPATLLLLGLGLAGMVGIRRKMKR